MYEGQELYERLIRIYKIMSAYASDTQQYLSMLRKMRADKQYIETKGLRGKWNLSIATGIIFLAVFGLLYGVICRDFETVIVMVVALIVYFTCKNIYPKISKTAIGVLIFILVMWLINIVIMAAEGVWGGVVLFVIALPAAIQLMKKALKVNRSYVDSYNEEVRQYNAPYIKKYRELYAEAQELDRALQSEIQGWYPPNYVNIEAVSFFINAIVNGKADTVKELVNLYDIQRRHNEIVSNQREQIELTRYGIEAFLDSQRNIEEQLRFNNMIGLYQVFQLSDIRKRI